MYKHKVNSGRFGVGPGGGGEHCGNEAGGYLLLMESAIVTQTCASWGCGFIICWWFHAVSGTHAGSQVGIGEGCSSSAW